MRFKLAARDQLETALARLSEDHLVVIELSELGDLLSDEESGIDDIVATLMAAKRLPSELTVRVALPEGAPMTRETTEVEAALHRRAAALSSVAWREGMAVRSTGLAQLPLGLIIAIVSWVAAYVLGYLATQVDGGGAGLLAVTAMFVITVAWVVSWVTVEAAVLDWRPSARQAAALDLLARAKLEVTNDPRPA
ncbi:MAG TPA: hypothetical protein VK461_15545 [Acidimicrobiales bacterium]|nr:hypothetical protein [Acidimicrobiales bacterium]